MHANYNHYMVDSTSFRIILELCRDGKLSNAKIAEILNISEVTVAKKIDALLSNGIIAIKGIPNPVRMGYVASAFIGLKVDLKKINDVCTQLMDNTHINLVVTCFGRFDILLIVYFREWQGLQEFVRTELPGIKGINHIETYLISGVTKRYDDKKKSNTANKPVLVDDIDQQIIQELGRNGRPCYADVARRLGISVSTVSRRTASLLRDDLIEIVAIPNPPKLGYSASGFVLLSVDLSKIDSICDQLAHFPEVHLVMRLMNDYDILFGVNTTDPETLFDFFKNKIANIDGILSSETFIRGEFLYFSADAMFMPSIR